MTTTRSKKATPKETTRPTAKATNTHQRNASSIDDLELLRRLTGTSNVSLKPTELRVAAYLVAKAKTEDAAVCNCSKHELADAFGVSEKTIDRALSRLCNEGLIQSIPQFSDSGAQLPNAYRILSS